jgi:membrane protease YdiL (CAAX protease family)
MEIVCSLQTTITNTAHQAADATHLDPITLLTFAAAAVILLTLFFAKILRPGALDGRKVDAHPWWVWLICGVVTFYCGLFAAILIATAHPITGPAPATGEEASLRYQSITQLAMYGASLLVATVFLRLLRASAPQAGLSVTPKNLLIGVGCLLLALPIVAAAGDIAILIRQSTTTDAIEHLAHPLLKDIHKNTTDPWAWVLSASAIFLAPVQEEILFRAFLQSTILRLTKRPWLSILIAGLAFAAAHLGAGMPWYAIVPVFVLGLSMGVAFEKTKTLGAPIAMHILFNATNIALVMLAK